MFYLSAFLRQLIITLSHVHPVGCVISKIEKAQLMQCDPKFLLIIKVPTRCCFCGSLVIFFYSSLLNRCENKIEGGGEPEISTDDDG